jgi:uncharacterized protein YjiS (DUF1127 family)
VKFGDLLETIQAGETVMKSYALSTHLSTSLTAEQALLGAKSSLSRALSTLSVWRTRAEQRRRLAEMDDYLLLDMGMHRLDALREAEKPFWRE